MFGPSAWLHNPLAKLTGAEHDREIVRAYVTSKRRRRDHRPELKRQLVERALEPGASAAAIALEAGINANLHGKRPWRAIASRILQAQIEPGRPRTMFPQRHESGTPVAKRTTPRHREAA